jgi:hypothetical protein
MALLSGIQFPTTATKTTNSDTLAALLLSSASCQLAAAFGEPIGVRTIMTKLSKTNLTTRVARGLAKTPRQPPRGLAEGIVWHAVDDLKSFPGNPRRHPESQIAGLMKSIRKVWTNPILIDESATILAGHCRLEAAKRLGMSEVPTVTITGLSPSEKRAILIADNRLPERAVWDFDVLRGHFKDLIEIDFDVELTGFTTGEIDLVLDGRPGTLDPADDLSGLPLDRPAVSKMGDVWELGRHRLICGDALRGDDYHRLLGGEVAQMVVTDPPFNVKIHGHAMGRGTIRHREFKVASGEMSESEFTVFLDGFIRLAVRHSQDGSIHFVFMDCGSADARCASGNFPPRRRCHHVES